MGQVLNNSGRLSMTKDSDAGGLSVTEDSESPSMVQSNEHAAALQGSRSPALLSDDSDLKIIRDHTELTDKQIILDHTELTDKQHKHKYLPLTRTLTHISISSHSPTQTIFFYLFPASHYLPLSQQ